MLRNGHARAPGGRPTLCLIYASCRRRRGLGTCQGLGRVARAGRRLHPASRGVQAVPRLAARSRGRHTELPRPLLSPSALRAFPPLDQTICSDHSGGSPYGGSGSGHRCRRSCYRTRGKSGDGMCRGSCIHGGRGSCGRGRGDSDDRSCRGAGIDMCERGGRARSIAEDCCLEAAGGAACIALALRGVRSQLGVIPSSGPALRDHRYDSWRRISYLSLSIYLLSCDQCLASPVLTICLSVCLFYLAPSPRGTR